MTKRTRVIVIGSGFGGPAAAAFLNPFSMLRIVPDLIRWQSHRSVYGLVSRYVRDDRLRQILSCHPLLVGGNPFRTTSIYALIHYLEREWGVWYAKGGTGAIVEALTRRLAELGGELRLNARVDRILVEGDRATGVRLAGGEELPADIIASKADVAATYGALLPARGRRPYPKWRLRRTHYSMSLVVIYFGANRRYRQEAGNRLAHHNILLGPRYHGLLDDIFRRKVLADDFSLYLHMPILTDPSLAPPGHEACYVLAPVPHLGGDVDWAAAATPYRDLLMSFLEERYLPDLSRHPVTERMIDPRHYRDVLGSYLGSACSVEPVLTQSAYFRPRNRAARVPNLYFVGAGTHPGAGLPGVLSSARIVDDLIQAHLRQ